MFKNSINDAIDQLLEEGYLPEFFRKKELRDMFAEVFSYDQELIDKGISQGIDIGIEQGLEQGIEQGAHEKAIEMAKTMLDSKATLDYIVKFSGLSLHEIQRLAV